TMLLIITRAWAGKFQFVFGIDEEATKADDLISRLQSALYFRVEFALNSGLDLDRYILPTFFLNVNDVFVSFLNNGFIGDRQGFTAYRDDLDNVVQAVGVSNSRQRYFHACATFLRRDLSYPGLKH